jgi:hypothetical protein
MNIAYEHPESRREVILPNGQIMTRGEASLQDYTVKPYAELVAPASRVATMHPVHTDLVTVPPFGLAVLPGTAKAMGFTVSTAAPRVQASQANPERTWRTAVMQLPEVTARPAAAAELLSTQSHTTMTVESARAFLRGLPVEQNEEPTPVTTNHQPDPRAARLADIELSMAAFNRGKGRATGSQSLGVAKSLAVASADPVKLKRMTEIRATALALRIQHGESQLVSEYRNLSCVLQAHDQTGAPLATLMGQMGIDASKIMKGA